MEVLKVAALVIILAATVTCDFELPSNFPKCFRNDPNLNNCLLKATEEVRQSLENGIPSLHIPSIAPLSVYQIIFESHNAILDYKALLTDGTVSGFKGYKVSKITCDFKKLVVDYYLPTLSIEGPYELVGKIINLQMSGKGFLQVNFSGLHTVTTIDLQETTRNGIAYLDITKIEAKMNIDDFDFNATGLSGDGLSENEANKFISDNRKILLEAFTPTFEGVIEEILETMVFKHIFKVPLDKLFPTK